MPRSHVAWFAILAAIPGPHHDPVPKGLYTDAEIRKLAKYDIDKDAGVDVALGDIPGLGVVPKGKSRPRGEVFRSLGLEDSRLRDFRRRGKNSVAYLIWQASPSYDICCMTSDSNWGIESLKNPQRKIFRVVLLKRADERDW